MVRVICGSLSSGSILPLESYPLSLTRLVLHADSSRTYASRRLLNSPPMRNAAAVLPATVGQLPFYHRHADNVCSISTSFRWMGRASSAGVRRE